MATARRRSLQSSSGRIRGRISFDMGDIDTTEEIKAWLERIVTGTEQLRLDVFTAGANDSAMTESVAESLRRALAV